MTTLPDAFEAMMASAEVPWMTRVPIDIRGDCGMVVYAHHHLQRSFNEWQRDEQDKARSQLARNGEDTW
jgi:hypothetical protein